mgnify:CR=1 FL=1
MENTELLRYRRALKRKNYSAHTVKSYINILEQFIAIFHQSLAGIANHLHRILFTIGSHDKFGI